MSGERVVMQPSRIRLEVHCGGCKGLIGTWADSVAEKYPFWCDGCDEYARDGAYPWTLTATIEGQAVKELDA